MKGRKAPQRIERRDIRGESPQVTDDGKIVGLAIPFNSWTTIGSGKRSFRERVAPGAITKTLQEGDVVYLDNHDDAKPIARKSAGTLTLTPTGRYEAEPADTTYARDLVTNIRAKNILGNSFGFEVVKESWQWGDDGIEERTLLEIKLPEISACTFPAYTDTEIGMRSAYDAAMESRSRFYESREGRAAKANYSDLHTCGECNATGQYGAYCGSCGEAMGDMDSPGNDYCTSCGAAMDSSSRSSHQCETRGGNAPGDGSKPYGNVTYADPGYQSDKKKRYPIDTKKHVQAAWSYINKAKNAAAYTADQLAKIKAKIKAAAKKFGITISDDRSFADFELRGYDPLTGFETRQGPSPLDAVDQAIAALEKGDMDEAKEVLQTWKDDESPDDDDEDDMAIEDSAFGVIAHTTQAGSAVPIRSNGEIAVAVSPRTLQRAYDLIREVTPTAQTNEALRILEPLLEAEPLAGDVNQSGAPKPGSSTSAVSRDSDEGRELAKDFEALRRSYRR